METLRQLAFKHGRAVRVMMENSPQLSPDEIASLYYRAKLAAHYGRAALEISE